MNEKKPEKRKNPRAKVSRFLDCSARFDRPLVNEAVIEDLSWGGMRVNFAKTMVTAYLQNGDTVIGQVESDNPALQMSFVGKIRWIEVYSARGEERQRAGIKFDEGVVSSEILFSLRPQGDSEGPA